MSVMLQAGDYISESAPQLNEATTCIESDVHSSRELLIGKLHEVMREKGVAVAASSACLSKQISTKLPMVGIE